MGRTRRTIIGVAADAMFSGSLRDRRCRWPAA
jgi:hypothetical protein